MDFGQDKSYDEFFDKMHSGDGTRNLRQIFEDDDKPLQNETNNLRYQPHSSQQQRHEQHKKKAKPPVASRMKHIDISCLNNWSTVVAKVAYGYNGSDNVGRVGVALSRNAAGASKLVVYKTKTHLLSTRLLTRSTTTSSPHEGDPIVIMRECYMQFYDDDDCFWSLRFEVGKDEQEFTRTMLEIGIPIGKVNESPPPASKASKSVATTEVTAGDSSENESIDIIVPPRERPVTTALMTLLPAKSNSSSVPIVTTQQAAATTATAATNSQLEHYLDEQRATGQSIDKKMDSILQAMRRLDCTCSTEGRQTFDHFLQQMSLDNHTDEDELLELEQKLLNFKKQNRALVKNLRAKEQALIDLRASTCALCEQLISQNNELKVQNTALIAAMSNTVASGAAGVSNCSCNVQCVNCEQYVAKIAALERHVATLQDALLNGTDSAPATATTYSVVNSPR